MRDFILYFNKKTTRDKIYNSGIFNQYNNKMFTLHKDSNNKSYLKFNSYINKRYIMMLLFEDLNTSKLGYLYEREIVSIFKKQGYFTTLTAKTNDYGVDIIATLDNEKIAIQCKYYSSNVGVQAVQEVYSGMVFHDCNTGIVMSNNEYTKNAIELANKLNIILITKK